ncbi:MAG: phosphatidylglycerophosphatase A [Sulfuriflexus sp.]|nr:phosphatidylglycerophosphatase A [Sulfuriflexus sp.]
MKPAPLPSSIWTDPLMLLACGLGSGAARFAPGTFGTLVAIPLYWFMQPLSALYYGLITIVLFFIGIGLCGYAARKLNVHDHPGIVWDEIVGYLITMFMAPTGLLWIIVGFALFRLFDIWKPWPIGWLDAKVSGGFGIMIDDVLAGVYAAGLLQLLVFLLP